MRAAARQKRYLLPTLRRKAAARSQTSDDTQRATRASRAVMRLPPALRNRNYRLYFFGQGLSVLGTWMQRVAMHWLVYRLSGSELLLGLSGFMSQIPVLFLGPLGGVWADRVDRRRLLMLTQALAMMQAGVAAGGGVGGPGAGWVRP